MNQLTLDNFVTN